MKKILIIHTKYKNFGGEDSNIHEEIRFLKKNFIVDYLEFNNSGSLTLIDLFGFLFNFNLKSNKLLKEKIESFQPDIAYIHNTWFRANLGIFKVLYKKNIEIVLKIHNFRFFCTKYFSSKKHFGEKSYCSMCGNKKFKFSFFNKYFEESYLKSFFVVIYGKKYFKILKDFPLQLFVLNNFYKQFLINEKIIENKITIFYNPIDEVQNSNYNPDSSYAVYAGQISNQKGVPELIRAWRKSKIELDLVLIGNGPLFNELKLKYKDSNIKFLGFQKHDVVLDYIKNSKAVVTSTKLYEGQPRILLEASISGVPSIFPDYGGMSEYFPDQYQLSFEQFNYENLLSKIKLLLNKEILMEESKNIQNFINDSFYQKFKSDSFLNLDIK